MILGYYDHDLEWPESNPGESEDEIQATLRHHKQFYSNGSKCDLTGDLRKTEVRVSWSLLYTNLQLKVEKLQDKSLSYTVGIQNQN